MIAYTHTFNVPDTSILVGAVFILIVLLIHVNYRKKTKKHIGDLGRHRDSILEQIPSGVLVFNAQKHVTAVNREALRIMGRNAPDIQGRALRELPEALSQTVDPLFSDGATLVDYKTTLNRDANHSTPLRLNGTLLYSEDKKVAGAVIVLTDLTAITDLEQCIRRTDRLAALGTVAAGLIHEIKNPLVTLKTFVQLLPERYDDEEFRLAFSSLLGQEIKRIDSLVNQLLGFARTSKPKLMPTYVQQVVDNTLKLLQQPLLQKNIKVVKNYGAPIDLVRADADSLMQAFFNLFLNAVDAMENGGQLIVTTKIIDRPDSFRSKQSPPTYFSISVKDTGRGIRQEDLPNIFNPFFTTKVNGTGLGLTVVHKIVQEHNGYMEVESVEGDGTTFQLCFPIMQSEVPA